MIPNQPWVVKLLKVIVSFLLIFIVYKTLHSYRFELEWPGVGYQSFYFICLVILLMPLNWLFESLRWRFVLRKMGHGISIKNAFQSTIVGLTFSLITPFRIGDYVGRMLLIRSEQKKISVYATLLCSVYQNFVNFFFGVVAMFFLFRLSELLVGEMSIFVVFNLLALSLVLLLIYKIEIVLEYLFSWPWIKEKFSIGPIIRMELGDKFSLFGLTLLRYGVYVLQYVLILYSLNVDNSLFQLLACISAIYFIQSAIPLPAFLNFLARIEIAVLVWKIIGLDISTALAATAVLWVINLMVPALLGLVIVLFKWR